MFLTSNFPTRSSFQAGGGGESVQITKTQCNVESPKSQLSIRTVLFSVPYPELVGPELVYIGPGSGYRLVPEAELEQQLISTGQQHLPSLFSVLHELLIRYTQNSIHHGQVNSKILLSLCFTQHNSVHDLTSSRAQKQTEKNIHSIKMIDRKKKYNSTNEKQILHSRIIKHIPA